VNVPRITLRVALCGGAGGCDDDDYDDDLVYACLLCVLEKRRSRS
jgi:hypothetical protein